MELPCSSPLPHILPVAQPGFRVRVSKMPGPPGAGLSHVTTQGEQVSSHTCSCHVAVSDMELCAVMLTASGARWLKHVQKDEIWVEGWEKREGNARQA